MQAFEYTWETELDDKPISVVYEVMFNYKRGSPEVRTLRNGDPGYPADPPSIALIGFSCLSVVKNGEKLNHTVDEEIDWENRFDDEVFGNDSLWQELCEQAEKAHNDN